MASFALITEGITDQILLEAILPSIVSNVDEVVYIQPIRDETDRLRQENYGGWENVFEACANEELLLSALSVNDYLIIQIDTDVAEHPNFGVSLTVRGADRPDSELIEEVKDLIISRIPSEIYNAYHANIIFAIAVHSLECWLLCLHSEKPSDLKRTKNCEGYIRRLLGKNGLGYEKTAKCYQILCKQKIIKSKIIKLNQNSSYEFFMRSLQYITSFS